MAKMILQSHLGLISTPYRLVHFERFNRLSIPSWSDFNRKKDDRTENLLDILSIPSWSDFNSPATLKTESREKFLSIPSWSDFNKKTITAKISLRQDFQSHLGLISTNLKSDILRKKKYFQSHLGLISTLYPHVYISFMPNSLSIPPWSDFNYVIKKHYCCHDDFQSHLGLISTDNCNSLSRPLRQPFNPTLV